MDLFLAQALRGHELDSPNIILKSSLALSTKTFSVLSISNTPVIQPWFGLNQRRKVDNCPKYVYLHAMTPHRLPQTSLSSSVLEMWWAGSAVI